jgi:hypothetical protein
VELGQQNQSAECGRLSQIGCRARRHLDVKLMDRLVSRESQIEDSAYGGRLNNSTESLIKIDARALCEVAKNPSHLVSIKGTIGQ